PFANDGTPTSAIIKSIKRLMAGEYSRELSQKVYAGKSKVIQMGYRAGGSAGFGLRRLLVDNSGRPRGVLEFGQQKFASTDRVVQVPGPPKEVAVVRWLFRQVAGHRRSPYSLAAELNRRGVPTERGRPWTRQGVLGIVTNEKYIGNLIFNRTSAKLRGPRVRNPKEQWLRTDGAFRAI